MPPSAVRTIKDVIFWQYAKIISESAKFGKENYGFIMSKFKELQNGKIRWSSTIREWVKEHERPNECIYCGLKNDLTVEHILPRCCSGPDVPDNAIMVCKKCNSSKGGKSSMNGLDRIGRMKFQGSQKENTLSYCMNFMKREVHLTWTKII